jgi:hypothetical protein
MLVRQLQRSRLAGLHLVARQSATVPTKSLFNASTRAFESSAVLGGLRETPYKDLVKDWGCGMFPLSSS